MFGELLHGTIYPTATSNVTCSSFKSQAMENAGLLMQ